MHRLNVSIRNPVSNQRHACIRSSNQLNRSSSAALSRGGFRTTKQCKSWRMRASEDDVPGGADRSYEDLFAQEVKLRGLAGSYKDGEGTKGSLDPKGSTAQAKPADPFASSSSNTRTRPRSSPPPAMAGSREEADGGGAGIGGQRARSMAMVTEGLEGLIPRVTVLAQLGGGLFLAFLPFMALFSILFTIAFYAFGDSFIHGGMPNSQPLYLDPQELLSQPTVDPYISFR